MTPPKKAPANNPFASFRIPKKTVTPVKEPTTSGEVHLDEDEEVRRNGTESDW